MFSTAIETATLSGVDPHAYLRWVLARLAYRREVHALPLHELTPRHFKELTTQQHSK